MFLNIRLFVLRNLHILILSIIIGIISVVIGPFMHLEFSNSEIIPLLFFLAFLPFLFNSYYRAGIFIFLVITTPGSIDNFMPTTFIGPLWERGAVGLRIISYVDVLLFLSLIAELFYWKKNKILGKLHFPNVLKILIIIFISCTLISSIIALQMNDSTYEVGSILRGIMLPVRISFTIILGYLFFQRGCSVKPINIALLFSLFGLIANSFYVTLSTGSTRFVAGTYGNNIFANFLVVFVIILFSCFINSEFSRWNFLYLIGSILGLLQILLTGTRMAFVAVSIGLIVVLLLSNLGKFKKIRILFLIGTIFFVLWILTAVFLPSNILRLKDIMDITYYQSIDFSSSTTFGTRLLIWQSTLDMILSNTIWGVGPGLWNFTRYDYGLWIPVLLDTHNGYLQILCEFGIIVFLSYLMIIGYMLTNSIANIKRIKIPKGEAWGIITSLITWLVTDFTNSGIYKTQIQVLIWLIFTYLLIKTKEIKKIEVNNE